MTRAEMEQLKIIPAEIKAIKESLANPSYQYVNLYYKDYRTGKGIPKSSSEYDYDHQEWERLKKKLREKLAKLARLRTRAEKFIEAIEEPETRTILRLYYINGYTQDAIGKELKYDDSSISKKIDTFWKNSNNSN